MTDKYWVTTDLDRLMCNGPQLVEADSLQAALTGSDLRACDYYDAGTWQDHIGERVIVIAWRDGDGPSWHAVSRLERVLK